MGSQCVAERSGGVKRNAPRGETNRGKRAGARVIAAVEGLGSALTVRQATWPVVSQSGMPTPAPHPRQPPNDSIFAWVAGRGCGPQGHELM